MWSRGCGYTFTPQLQGLHAHSADEPPAHSIPRAGNVEARAKILSLEQEGWAEAPGGEGAAASGSELPGDSTESQHIFLEEGEAAADGGSLETDLSSWYGTKTWHQGSVQIWNKLFLAELGLGWGRRNLCSSPPQNEEIEVWVPHLPREQAPPRARITWGVALGEAGGGGMSSLCVAEIHFLSHPLQQWSWVMKRPNPRASSVCDRQTNLPLSCASINAPRTWWILGAGIPCCRAWHGSQGTGLAPTFRTCFHLGNSALGQAFQYLSNI